MKFYDAAKGIKHFKVVSAHIAKQNESGNYIALTAQTNLLYKPEDGNVYKATDGYFFLQRNGQSDYAARFLFHTDGIHFFKEINWDGNYN